jgi:hypothetical protein
MSIVQFKVYEAVVEVSTHSMPDHVGPRGQQVEASLPDRTVPGETLWERRGFRTGVFLGPGAQTGVPMQLVGSVAHWVGKGSWTWGWQLGMVMSLAKADRRRAHRDNLTLPCLLSQTLKDCVLGGDRSSWWPHHTLGAFCLQGQGWPILGPMAFNSGMQWLWPTWTLTGHLNSSGHVTWLIHKLQRQTRTPLGLVILPTAKGNPVS